MKLKHIALLQLLLVSLFLATITSSARTSKLAYGDLQDFQALVGDNGTSVSNLVQSAVVSAKNKGEDEANEVRNISKKSGTGGHGKGVTGGTANHLPKKKKKNGGTMMRFEPLSLVGILSFVSAYLVVGLPF